MNTLAVTIAVLATVGADPLDVRIALPDKPLNANQDAEFVIEWNLAEGVRLDAKGRFAPLVQILPSPAIELAGEPITDAKALARNGFLRAPFERLLKEQTTRVAFRPTREIADGERVFFNVLAYLHADDPAQTRFTRQRWELPLKPGAAARRVAATDSTWGDGSELQLGERAPRVELPRADGTVVKLDDVLGMHNVIITTYRAFW